MIWESAIKPPCTAANLKSKYLTITWCTPMICRLLRKRTSKRSLKFRLLSGAVKLELGLHISYNLAVKMTRSWTRLMRWKDSKTKRGNTGRRSSNLWRTTTVLKFGSSLETINSYCTEKLTIFKISLKMLKLAEKANWLRSWQMRKTRLQS